MPGNSPTPRQSAWIVVAMLAMVAIPARHDSAPFTLRAPSQIPSTNPTPYGYTWSLLLSSCRSSLSRGGLCPGSSADPKACLRANALDPRADGCGLDFFAAHKFSSFPTLARL